MLNFVLKPFKWLLYAMIAIVAVVAILVALLVFAVDPNWLKPEIQNQLSQHGIHVKIENDIAWQFYPSIGLQVSELILLDGQATETLLTIGNAKFSLALAPLLKQQIKVYCR